MSDEYVSRTISAYNANPLKYEQATADMTPIEEFDYFIKMLPTNGLPILDAGCAFGRDSAKFAQLGREVIGIDMSEELLARAKELNPSLVFKKMDIRNLELEDGSMAGVWCHATLLHLTDIDIRKSLKEFSRTLSAGGFAFITFKEGEGEEEIIEKFSSDGARFFNYQTSHTATELIKDSGLIVDKVYVINERERWGESKRDLNWVYCFARK